MGLMDKAKAAAAGAVPQPGWDNAPTTTTPTGPVGVCPYPTAHYVTEVNKDSIRMGRWQGHLNDMYARGYRLAHAFEQDGNTVQVFEHHFHP